MIHLDYETTSECDISLGHYRYASDPTTRILMFAVSDGFTAGDGRKPLIWRFDQPDSQESVAAKQVFRDAVANHDVIYAHNAPFELAVSHYRLAADVGIDPPKIEQWRCTKAMALRAAIPASLAGSSEFLGLTDKDKMGKALIGIFSDQSKLTTLSRGKERMKSKSPILEADVPWDWLVTVAGQQLTVREAWDRFIEYCRLDVVVEQELHQKLMQFELSGSELDGFLFDLRMNHRGIPINRAALTHANQIIETHERRLSEEFNTITGLTPSQTTKVLEWLRHEGYAGDNLQSETMERQLGSSFLTPEGQRALEIRSLLSFAAVKKIPSMLETACPDDVMRGLFQFHGAQKTGRWTASGPQPQNARKPSIRFPDDAYADICDGMSLEDIECFHGDPYEVIASCVRNFMQPHDGKQMLSLDLSNIESRIGALLAECEQDLEMYRNGRDLYKDLAASAFGVPYEKVTKDQRFVGKIGILSLCFQTSDRKLWETCEAWGQPVDKSVAIKVVRTFRSVKNEYPTTWKAYERAVVDAIKCPGKWFPATRWVKFGRSTTGAFDRLVMRLPSGRDIIYPHPQVRSVTKKHKDFETGEVREFEGVEITFYGANQKTRQWGRQATYAGSIYQSSVQATARDVMLHGCLEAEKMGFEIWALIHDEALANDGSVEDFHRAFTTVPPWLPQDFPLAAEGGRQPYYKKD